MADEDKNTDMSPEEDEDEDEEDFDSFLKSAKRRALGSDGYRKLQRSIDARATADGSVGEVEDVPGLAELDDPPPAPRSTVTDKTRLGEDALAMFERINLEISQHLPLTPETPLYDAEGNPVKMTALPLSQDEFFAHYEFCSRDFEELWNSSHATGEEIAPEEYFA